MLKIIWEKWKKVPQYQHIKVSSLGNIKINNKPYRPKVNPKGYFIVEVEPNKYKSLHRLVASAFLKERLESYETVDHKDSNRRNNAVSNLEIVTREENEKRALAVLTNPQEENNYTIPDWNVKITDGEIVYRTLYRAANNYATKHNISKDFALKTIVAAIVYGVKSEYPWAVVK